MAPFIPTITTGRFVRYSELPAANDGLIWMILQSLGLERDLVLRDKDSFADVLLGTTNEATFGGYRRVTATGVVVTTDDANNRTNVDANDPSWAPLSAQAVAKIVLGYDPDTTGGTDADILPVFMDDFVALTTPPLTLTYQVNAAGWGRATAL
jgi:hypothetical protein